MPLAPQVDDRGNIFLCDFVIWQQLGNYRLRRLGEHVQGAIKERWQKLCQQAVEEQDPARLLELAEEINRLLGEKEEPLNHQRIDSIKVA